MYKLLVILCILQISYFSHSADITIVTEQYPPYNFEENNIIKGMSTEVVQAVFNELGLLPEIKVYP